MERKVTSGFTAIELLICVAFIALLAAIALPNYRYAQTSANFAQARSDMQTLRTGLEAYKLDLGAYPWMNSVSSALAVGSGGSSGPTLERLTTPVSYLNNMAPFYDPFQATRQYEGLDLETVTIATADYQVAYFKQYFYNARNPRDTSTWGQFDEDPSWYLLESAGPDQHHHRMWRIMNAMQTDTEDNRTSLSKTIYDPTNGSLSRGSLWEVGGTPTGTGTSMATVINAANASSVTDWFGYGD